jgi:formate dehydrogenase major subunit
MAAALGGGWGTPTAEEVWDELRSLSPMHAGMSYERLEAEGGLQWPCYDVDHPGEQFLHARLWSDEVGRPAPFVATEDVPPVDELSDDYPLRMTTGRHLDSYNTGVQSGQFSSPRRTGGTVDVSPEDAARLGLSEGEVVELTSRRGSIDIPVRIQESIRPGLVFVAVHYPDDVDVNRLTIEAWDPKSGTAEFKATAVRIDKVT